MDPNFAFLDKIPHKLGFIVLNESGAIVKSGGDLSNRDNVADIIHHIRKLPSPFTGSGSQKKIQEIMINFGDYFYTVCHSGQFTFLIKRARPVKVL